MHVSMIARNTVCSMVRIVSHFHDGKTATKQPKSPQALCTRSVGERALLRGQDHPWPVELARGVPCFLLPAHSALFLARIVPIESSATPNPNFARNSPWWNLLRQQPTPSGRLVTLNHWWQNRHLHGTEGGQVLGFFGDTVSHMPGCFF